MRPQNKFDVVYDRPKRRLRLTASGTLSVLAAIAATAVICCFIVYSIRR